MHCSELKNTLPFTGKYHGKIYELFSQNEYFLHNIGKLFFLEIFPLFFPVLLLDYVLIKNHAKTNILLVHII